MDYKKLADQVITHVGGKKNIQNLTHCATRLRFNLTDDTKASTNDLKQLQGVLGVTKGGGQYQVIIGNDVEKVYDLLIEMLGFSDGGSEDKKNQHIGTRLIDIISSIFTPILPVITASGMLKALLALCTAFKWVDPATSTVYQVINFMADAAFYFLPIFLAISASKKFKCNTYLAAMLGGVLLHPNFIAMVTASKESGNAIKFAFLPIYNASYASTVIPIILTVWFMSYIERYAKKYSPKMIAFFIVPLITVLITGLVALVILGPVGYVVGNYIASGVIFLDRTAGWLVPTLLGACFPLLVMTGTHYGIIPIGANNIMTLGYDAMIGPGNLPSNIAQGGAALAVGIKTKKSDIKQLAFSSGITAVCGITEPALFGINVRFKTPLYAAMAGGGVGGLFIGLMGVRRFASGSPGLLTLPVYIGDKGLTNIINACIGCGIAFIVSFVISYLLYKEHRPTDTAQGLEQAASEQTAGNKQSVTTIIAPVSGKLVPIKQVKDDVFSLEMIGKGCAIITDDKLFVSPVKGSVTALYKTNHAIGIKSDQGVEVLIHIGIDTVKLNGQFFSAQIKVGDQVDIGTPLMIVDLDAIKAAGYDIITPIIITNAADYTEVLPITPAIVSREQVILKVIR
ncbi:beta-glucoside-specific PTS transporter subunit IIABC [Lactococcus carnosus]|uniref:beta-glucoside-specific PTS transporter subunit IIABC n=1 Tax=Pseudolactococcus carnosus TaxID=2749961 RepID=UPI0008129832|nr:beta-glucoside-specific PTS transporter subunit IIABC [Lactococcus carnosus]SCA93001.1 PTS system beta-glucoside-specific EIIBCA component (bglP family) [Lactococcus piscium]MCJ1969888.1 PTS transporter subunit EIIC [Lactococcus carnosus]MCJ1973919.1 PTS transporter subunit EIIC [Lactococcus carnosus]MCJ1976009.1 PTS transporter subunit EIIC [Lactococcus carnosus]MCJ1981834.1 PTS transporter subunit EIIC [Lactococcus carnosus]